MFLCVHEGVSWEVLLHNRQKGFPKTQNPSVKAPCSKDSSVMFICFAARRVLSVSVISTFTTRAPQDGLVCVKRPNTWKLLWVQPQRQTDKLQQLRGIDSTNQIWSFHYDLQQTDLITDQYIVTTGLHGDQSLQLIVLRPLCRLVSTNCGCEQGSGSDRAAAPDQLTSGERCHSHRLHCVIWPGSIITI